MFLKLGDYTCHDIAWFLSTSSYQPPIYQPLIFVRSLYLKMFESRYSPTFLQWVHNSTWRLFSSLTWKFMGSPETPVFNSKGFHLLTLSYDLLARPMLFSSDRCLPVQVPFSLPNQCEFRQFSLNSSWKEQQRSVCTSLSCKQWPFLLSGTCLYRHSSFTPLSLVNLKTTTAFQMLVNEQSAVNCTEQRKERAPTLAVTGLSWGRAHNQDLTLCLCFTLICIFHDLS